MALVCYTCVISLCLYQAGYGVFFTISFDLGFALFCMHGLARTVSPPTQPVAQTVDRLPLPYRTMENTNGLDDTLIAVVGGGGNYSCLTDIKK